MRKQRNDFDKKSQRCNESWYDLREDWTLIESSFAKQYSVRLRSENDMPWPEFSTLLSGLMPDTPLGQVVSIRAEKDEETIKRFTTDQKRIYDEYHTKMAKRKAEDTEQFNKEMANLATIFTKMFVEGGI